jgi:hypothetical protein
MRDRPPERRKEKSMFDLDRAREGEGGEFFERTHPAKPHVRLIALLIVIGLVGSSCFVVLSILFGG